jgi:hypothetical protein
MTPPGSYEPGGFTFRDFWSVIAGLDPTIHAAGKMRQTSMDAWVKPGHDGSRITTVVSAGAAVGSIAC